MVAWTGVLVAWPDVARAGPATRSRRALVGQRRRAVPPARCLRPAESLAGPEQIVVDHAVERHRSGVEHGPAGVRLEQAQRRRRRSRSRSGLRPTSVSEADGQQEVHVPGYGVEAGAGELVMKRPAARSGSPTAEPDDRRLGRRSTAMPSRVAVTPRTRPLPGAAPRRSPARRARAAARLCVTAVDVGLGAPADRVSPVRAISSVGLVEAGGDQRVHGPPGRRRRKPSEAEPVSCGQQVERAQLALHGDAGRGTPRQWSAATGARTAGARGRRGAPAAVGQLGRQARAAASKIVRPPPRQQRRVQGIGKQLGLAEVARRAPPPRRRTGFPARVAAVDPGPRRARPPGSAAPRARCRGVGLVDQRRDLARVRTEHLPGRQVRAASLRARCRLPPGLLEGPDQPPRGHRRPCEPRVP